MRDILDVHCHTLASGHAYNTVWEMARAAREKGLEILGLTDHAPQMPGSCGEFHFLNLKVVPRQIEGICVLHGSEVNIMDYEGSVDLPERILKQMDLVIASLHTPCIKPGTVKENTNACIKAMENPYINIIGHPDDGRFPLDYKELVAAARENHVLLEINNNSLNPQCFRQNAGENDRTILKLCMEYGVPVIMGSDAHVVTDVGNHVRAFALIEEIGFPEELVVNRDAGELMKYINYGKQER
ncbi:MAG: phosphatase [Eubacteriales bacterium]|nr:phosphatase [Eubacteriales bacterium]